jgi:DNA repair exonuclease SbcCD ATPase subunit
MIQLTSIDIKDFGRHHHIDSKFSGHVVGLAGPNGRGKSTVLQAIQFALTGTIAHKDPLRAFIRRSSCENPPAAAEVTLEFVADGKVGKIQRRITRTTVTRKLWWDGAKTPMTSDEKVNETMFAILGVDKKAINSTVFIRQGEMANMFGEETDRRDFYTRLLMLGHLAKLALTIETYRESTASSVQDLGAVRDAAQRTYDEARTYFEQCEREQSEAPSASEHLTLVRAVEAAMAQVTAAEDASTAAHARLAHLMPADDPDVAVWLTDALRQSKEWQEKFEQLAQRKQTHSSASANLAKTELTLSNMRALKQQYEDLNEASAKLKDAESALGDSPAPGIKKAEATLQKFVDFDLLGTTIPEAVKAEETVRPKLAAAETEVTSWEQIYNTARENYAVLRDALKLRRDLLRAACISRLSPVRSAAARRRQTQIGCGRRSPNSSRAWSWRRKKEHRVARRCASGLRRATR